MKRPFLLNTVYELGIGTILEEVFSVQPVQLFNTMVVDIRKESHYSAQKLKSQPDKE